MSVTTATVEYFIGCGAGERKKAADVVDGAAYDATREAVFMALASLSQPGKPLQREKIDGVYWYELRPGVDYKPYLDGSPIKAPTAHKPAAAQVPAVRETAGTASAGAGSRQVEPAKDVKGNAGASTLPPAAGPGRLILPTNEPNPHRPEVLRFIDDLRIRRAAIDEVIQLLESTFKVTHE